MMAMAYNNYKLLQQRPSNNNGLMNTIFMSTVNMATKMLLSVTSTNFSFSSASGGGTAITRWRPRDHLRFLCLIFSWFSMWALHLVSDLIPSSSLFSRLIPSSLHSAATTILPAAKRRVGLSGGSGGGGDGGGGINRSSNQAAHQLALVPSTRSTMSYDDSYSSPVVENNLDLIAHDGFLVDGGGDHYQDDRQSLQALGRALSHTLGLLNELPATSRKYDFAMAMADRILDENTRDGHVDLLQVNRVALSSAFERTVNLLHRTLNNAAVSHANQAANENSPWTMRAIRKLPLGSYITAYMSGGWGAVFPALESVWRLEKRRLLSSSPLANDGDEYVGPDDRSEEVVGAEKLAQELLWMTNKLRASRAVDEALVQWGHASELASLSLNVNPRVQSLLIKISASLIGDVARAGFDVPTQVQYRLLVLWLPLFCYTGSALRYPVLSSYEKIEVKRSMEQMIAALPAAEQEIVLRNWLQDFAICASDWPNLQQSYDHWCQSSRHFVVS